MVKLQNNKYKEKILTAEQEKTDNFLKRMKVDIDIT